MHCIIFIRVDATNEIAYEFIAEPVLEQQSGEQQEEAVEQAPEEVANPADLQGKPRSITLNSRTSQCLILLCICIFTF